MGLVNVVCVCVCVVVVFGIWAISFIMIRFPDGRTQVRII